jgi:hypothetical protein
LQACEQLNAWLGGYELILERMTGNNFNWFLHSMLFYHTQYVIQKQKNLSGLEVVGVERASLDKGMNGACKVWVNDGLG